MAFLRVIDRAGREHEVEGKTGLKVMETLRELDYGVAAICGGTCSCATCHIYVDAEWQRRLPAPISDERELLAELAHTQENSRLSCQIEFTTELAGLRITTLRTSRTGGGHSRHLAHSRLRSCRRVPHRAERS
jgi:2Fe-2S ferredoxin